MLLGQSLPHPVLNRFLGLCHCLDGATNLMMPRRSSGTGWLWFPVAAAGPSVTSAEELFYPFAAPVWGSQTRGMLSREEGCDWDWEGSGP